MPLLTEESVELPLYPGNCQIQEVSNLIKVFKEENGYISIRDHIVNTFYFQDEEPLNTTSTIVEYVVSKANATKSPPIDLQDNELPEDSPQRPFLLADAYEWTPDNENAGRAFGMTNTKTAPGGAIEIAEPVLKPRPRKTPRQRADSVDPPEISEPVLRPTQAPRTTQPPSRKAKNYDMSTTPNYDTGERADKEDTSFAVQFLPARLASFISRAERYARDTLLPLVSAYAPRLPIFGARELPKPTTRYIPTEEINVTSSVPVPTPTLEMKIQTLRTVGPPGEKRYMESPEDPDITTTTTTTKTPPTTTVKFQPAPTEMLKVVSGPAASTSTALPPVALRTDGEKIVIVYPSNARDERKIRSHSFPEELQFEALYRHTAAPSAVRVDLPTFSPPTSTYAPPSTEMPKADSRYIPVPFHNLKKETEPS